MVQIMEDNNTNNIQKIVYFDKETIRNILQERNKGERTHTYDSFSSVHRDSSLETGGKIELGTPFFARLKFLFSGKMEIKYITRKDETTTISSTEISEFEQLKSSLERFPSVKLQDIENSTTFFRVAGGYMKIIKGGVDGLDVKEFNNVLDSFNGYDTYRINDDTYVRFNNSSFVSNYKRNDILTTTMTLYCIPVGVIEKERFDFQREMLKMEKLSESVSKSSTLYEMYPPDNAKLSKSDKSEISCKDDMIKLFDVIYACTESGEKKK